jgi:hypothetical protein
MSALENQVGGNHYKDAAIQHVEYAHANRLPYIEANIIKYIVRHDKKNGIEDLKKAMHYLEILMDLEYDFVSE